MASVSIDDVRDVLHIRCFDIPDAKVLKMIKRAAVTLALELSEDIDYSELLRFSKRSHHAFGCHLRGLLLDWRFSHRLKL